MKKGCLVGLFTWGVCAGAYWYYIHGRFQPPLDWAVPVVAGLLMAVVIGNLRAALSSAVSASRLSQQSTFAGSMGEKPKDGEVVTVPGHIRATGSALRAPFSDRPAVLYSYDVSRTWSDAHGVHSTNDFSGFGLTPSVIDSPYGAIRILGFPMLEGFSKEQLDSESNVAKAKEYLATATFQDMRFNPLAMYREVKDLMSDDDGQVHKDWKMTTDAELRADASLHEQIVAPGDQVTAIGKYSAAQDGLVPDMGNPLRLIRGDAQVVAGSLWKKATGTVIGAVLFAAFVNGALFGFLRFRGAEPIGIPKSTSQKRLDRDALHAAAKSGDTNAMGMVLGRRTPVDSREDDESTPLMHAADAKTASWLIEHGADVNATNYQGDTVLMLQARAGNAEVVKVLVKSGAKLDAISTKWKTTALQQALDAEKLDVAQILRDAGAHDVTVTEKNGKAVGSNSVPLLVVMKYLGAIQREDLQTMESLSTRAPFKNVDFKEWKSVRPLEPHLLGGFAGDGAATIVVRGKRADGVYSTWTLQVVSDQEGHWKISDERWETRLDSRKQ
ncbi:MAG TPA: ankyrin repeat domain-containing protein [Thermoanaerobaculia bacterium]|nr:ankyrin repeat domain-containing protein [Thermoanaerobaculia bacterium]